MSVRYGAWTAADRNATDPSGKPCMIPAKTRRHKRSLVAAAVMNVATNDFGGRTRDDVRRSRTQTDSRHAWTNRCSEHRAVDRDPLRTKTGRDRARLRVRPPRAPAATFQPCIPAPMRPGPAPARQAHFLQTDVEPTRAKQFTAPLIEKSAREDPTSAGSTRGAGPGDGKARFSAADRKPRPILNSGTSDGRPAVVGNSMRRPGRAMAASLTSPTAVGDVHFAGIAVCQRPGGRRFDEPELTLRQPADVSTRGPLIIDHPG